MKTLKNVEFVSYIKYFQEFVVCKMLILFIYWTVNVKCLIVFYLFFICYLANLSSESKSPLGRQPNPNNPMEYCSTIPPLQQAAGSLHQPPPSVLVPVGVLKREGNLH